MAASFWGARASVPEGVWAGDAAGWASATETCFRAEAVLGRLSVSPWHPSLELLAAGRTARGGQDVRGHLCTGQHPPEAAASVCRGLGGPGSPCPPGLRARTASLGREPVLGGQRTLTS